MPRAGPISGLHLQQSTIWKIPVPQQFGCKAIINALALPTAHAGSRIDVQFLEAVADALLRLRVVGDGWQCAGNADEFAAWVTKQQLPGRRSLTGKATLVHKPVMMTAQQYEVVHAGFAAVRPNLPANSITVIWQVQIDL